MTFRDESFAASGIELSSKIGWSVNVFDQSKPEPIELPGG
jgi:hypothetical protein